MLAEERQMIESLSTRLHEAGTKIEKDQEAAALIEEKISSQKDVVYQLTQATLLQEHALGQAQQQIAQLRAELAQQHQQTTEQKPSGSFLGNLFGGSKQQAAPPSAAGFATGNNPMPGQQQFANNMRSQGGGFMGSGVGQQGAGGSFLRNAAAGAVGVAGGMFLFEGLSHLFGGNTAQAVEPSEVINETVINEATPTENSAAGPMDVTDQQGNIMDTGGFDQGTFDNNSFDDFSDFGGTDDFGGGDFGGDW
ncbi:hypothetical protein PsalN5692_00152 [Piscirickettsia salmonis]|nr:DUF2076 domain-containing protein [Piscirickettsia salmonis]QGP48748.1 hypothetical protein PsalN5692_00152 [Piscirickettsia salmonis]QGP52774.1 hypothetical protein PsalSR1_00164 [Piscirickettsia salmonis]QGP57637.1 hypothetical protein PsalBI1_00174 [Piscirickettsia salmonis]QGP62342.1 hypothetical protein PsalMR5_00164 [Piscirickettsia salmonis]